MKIRVECKCGEILEIELNESFEVISVENIEDSIEISSDLMNELGIEFG